MESISKFNREYFKTELSTGADMYISKIVRGGRLSEYSARKIGMRRRTGLPKWDDIFLDDDECYWQFIERDGKYFLKWIANTRQEAKFILNRY